MDILSVARRAWVLTAIVSRVINSSNKVRETSAKLVREAILGLQYVPNNSA
jgi:DNA-binding LacI/PurR family transcriptional regulator